MIVRWSLLARHDLQTLRAYIALDNPGAAASVARRITAAANRLVHYPHLGRPGRQPDSRELVVPRTPYLLIYAVGEQRVEIVRVLHGAAALAAVIHDVCPHGLREVRNQR